MINVDTAWVPSAPSLYEGGLPVDTVFGLPIHPLVVHAAVVLLPLAAVGLIVMATDLKRSRRYGGAVVLLAASAAASAFLAVASGRDLAARYGYGEQAHFELGEWMPWFASALLAATVLLLLLDKKPPSRSAVGRIVALVSVVIALATIVATIRTGHLGAELTWGSRT